MFLLELAHYIKRHCAGAVGQGQCQGAVLGYLPEERATCAVLACLDVKAFVLQMPSSRGIGQIARVLEAVGAGLTEAERVAFYNSLTVISNGLETLVQTNESRRSE